MFHTTELMITFLILTNQHAHGMEMTLEEKIDACYKSFERYLVTTESQWSKLKKAQDAIPSFLNGAFKRVASCGASIAGFGNIDLDEIAFVRRLFEDSTKKNTQLQQFLEKQNLNRTHLIQFFTQFERTKQKDTLTDANELLVSLLHQHTTQQLNQSQSSSRLEITNQVLEKNDAGVYLVCDESYFPLVLHNLFAMHVFERFYKK